MEDETKSRPVEYRGTGFYVSLVFAAVVVVAMLVLALQNTESVTFEFLGWTIDLPLFGVIIIAALLAVTIDELVGVVWRRRRRRRLSEKHELASLRKARDASPADSSDLPPISKVENEPSSPPVD
jgi:uncharacterized integral membrane protein